MLVSGALRVSRLAPRQKRYFLSIIFCLLAVVGFAQGRSPSVLILDSYHPGYAWSDNELAGLMERLREGYPDIDPSIEFLDAKRFPSWEHLQTVRDFLQKKYVREKLDLILALDNSALDMLVSFAKSLFPDVPVVFAGYNGFSSEVVTGRKKVTGVAELEDEAGTIRIALSLFPHATHLLVLDDQTATGIAARKNTEKLLPVFSHRVSATFAPPVSFRQAADLIKRLPPDSFVMIGPFSTDKDGLSLPLDQGTQLLTAAANVPAFSNTEVCLGYGIIGGSLLRGQDQGRRAGDIALRVLAGENPEKIPVVMESTSRPMFDYRLLSRYKIPLNALPTRSIVINKPVSLFDRYGTAALWALAIFGALCAMVVFLFVAVIRRRKAERELAQSESRLRVILDSTSDVILATDVSRIATACNPAMEQLFGYRPQEVLGRSVEMLHFSAEHFKRFGEIAFPIVERDGFWRGEWEYRRKDGSPLSAESVITAQKTAEGKLLGYVGVIRDIRERKRAQEALHKTEEKLQQAQKMEAVGRLAGGIAHDFNNLLTVIRGYGDLALERTGQADPLRADLVEIRRASERATMLTAQLLAFSRKQIFQPRVFSLNDLVADMTKMLQRLIGEDIELSTSLAQGSRSVKADPGQIEQVIMNLVLNARDAMPQGGRLVLETAEMDLGDEFVREHPEVRKGRYVSLTIRDTGIGMDKETLSHLFEPFFTTKEKGKGTGLGLSTVYGVMKQSGGHVFCASTPGSGTSFTLYLPCTEASAQKELHGAGGDAVRGGSETIILVEDEDAVRGFVKSTLTGWGYTVRESRDGQEALQLIFDEKAPADLVITDVVMPRMSGRELAQRIRSVRPDAKILFISGYAGGSMDSPDGSRVEEHFIQKPFSPEDLVKEVRIVLDEPV